VLHYKSILWALSFSSILKCECEKGMKRKLNFLNLIRQVSLRGVQRRSNLAVMSEIAALLLVAPNDNLTVFNQRIAWCCAAGFPNISLPLEGGGLGWGCFVMIIFDTLPFIPSPRGRGDNGYFVSKAFGIKILDSPIKSGNDSLHT